MSHVSRMVLELQDSHFSELDMAIRHTRPFQLGDAMQMLHEPGVDH